MNEYEMLLEYQRLDGEAEQFEKEMRQSPARQKLIKDRDYLLEQQNAMKKIEQDLVTMSERFATLEAEVKKVDESLTDLKETIEEDEPDTLDIAKKSLEYCQKLVGQITRIEQDLTKIRKDSDTRSRQQHEVRVRAAKVKAEFDTLKTSYDVEYKKQMVTLESLRAKTADAEKHISAELIEKYKRIKQHKPKPVARLNDDRCSGCNMNLPAVVLRSVRTGAPYVECENCGRIVLTNLGGEG